MTEIVTGAKMAQVLLAGLLMLAVLLRTPMGKDALESATTTLPARS